jgi:two-component system cell cycle sensor histidine kinase/response regulator CckA
LHRVSSLKPEIFAALENAAWPALLVDGAGVVLRANATAAKALGPTIGSGSIPLLSVWAAANPVKPDALLAQWDQAPTPVAPVKFTTAGGVAMTFQCTIAPVPQEDARVFLLQLFPTTPSAGSTAWFSKSIFTPAPQPTAPPSPQPATAESGVALKQKLDCALQLTRTVALDFNNTLTGILGHASLILGKIEPASPWRPSLQEIEKAAEKAAEIAYDLAAYSWQDKPANSQKAGNLNDLLTKTSELFQASHGNIMWAMQFEPRLCSASFDEPKIQQCFIKILDNAVQAITDNGRITVRTRNLDLAEPLVDSNIKLPAGRYVCAEIVDSGGGIAPEHLPKVFEPFFTTKQGPKHRGLGLAWVYGIVTTHNGFVAISSSVGQGTSVRVYLPALQKVVRGSISRDEDLSGDKTVLLVDDEDLLLTMGQMILSSYGYRVITANNGAKALEWLQRPEPRIDLMITDLVMPGMSGKELIDQARKVAPDVKILYTSGYVQPGASERSTYLQKPFSSQDLLRKVKQVFHGAEAAN